jgi:hypothetical protein
VFGGLVEFRTAYLRRRMGDLEVFLRAAWAVRAGEDIYVVTDSKGFHYHYPPLFAILLTPLADAPPGAERPWMLPFGASVLVWYVFNLGCLAVSLNWIALLLERHRQPALGSRRWWALRIWPLIACMPAVGGSLMRGQVDMLWLLLFTGMIVAAVRGRSFRAGLWLAAAICLKVIPAFLLLYPCWRRDVRWLTGCAVGLVIGLILVPAAVFGPRQTWAYFEEWQEVLIQPGLTGGGNQSRAKELIEVTATDTQSFMAIIHTALHPDRGHRPAVVSPRIRLVHCGLGALVTLLTLLAAGRTERDDPIATVLLFGALAVPMLMSSPVCHLHYLALLLPVVAGLFAAYWERCGTPTDGAELSAGLVLLAIMNIIANTVPRLPDMEAYREIGLAGYATLLIWGTACLALWRRRSFSRDAQRSAVA